MGKPKIGLYWCSSCGGCEESVVDLAEDILMVVEAVDIVFWPVAMDFKYEDVEALSDGELAVTLINGAIRMDEQEHIAKLLRKKSKLIIAHGSCAHLGGVVGLANFYKREEVLERAYKEVPSLNNPQGVLPNVKTEESGHEIQLSGFYQTVKPLDQVIDVDYYIPGCPPPPELIKNAITALLEGKLPPKGAVLAEQKALCYTCSRRDTKPDRLKIDGFKRVWETEWDPERCFLDQGIICLGPATRGGCGARCIAGNMPCRGCFGPAGTVKDQGAKALSFLASMVAPKGEGERGKIGDFFPDIAGLFYRYTLASSILQGKWGDDTR